MAERAHPEDPGFQNKWFGIKKSSYRKKLFERYKSCKNYTRNKIVLDIPCGVGWGTSLITNAKSLYGIDISRDAIEYATKNYQAEYCVGNMANIPFKSDSFETVICLEGFEHVTRDVGLSFLKEARRVLKLGSILILTCPVLNDQGETTGNPYHLNEYDQCELVDLLNRNFLILSLERFPGPDGPEIRAVMRKP